MLFFYTCIFAPYAGLVNNIMRRSQRSQSVLSSSASVGSTSGDSAAVLASIEALGKSLSCQINEVKGELSYLRSDITSIKGTLEDVKRGQISRRLGGRR